MYIHLYERTHFYIRNNSDTAEGAKIPQIAYILAI
jgi:hypothetical protein